MAAEGMSLVSRSLRISSQMLESSNSIRVKKHCRCGLQSRATWAVLHRVHRGACGLWLVMRGEVGFDFGWLQMGF